MSESLQGLFVCMGVGHCILTEDRHLSLKLLASASCQKELPEEPMEGGKWWQPGPGPAELH